MKRSIAAIVAVTALGIGLLANAGEGTKQTGTTPGATGTMGTQPTQMGTADPEMSKQLALVNVYLDNAKNNLKVLSLVADLPAGKLDTKIINETQRNLDTSIDKALTYAKQVRRQGEMMGMGGHQMPTDEMGQTQPVAGGQQDPMMKLDEFENHLKQAKSASKKLKGAKQANLAPAVDQVTTHLVAADQAFRDLSQHANFTALEDINLDTAPVRGTEDPAMQPQTPPGTEQEPMQPAPEPTQPSPDTNY